MPRSTNKLQFIEDEVARNETLRKGKKILIKKMSELKKFGDVDACLVMLDKEGGPPTVWPSTAEAHRLIEKYYELKRQRINAMQNYAVFLEKRVADEIQKGENLRNLMKKNLYDVSAISEITCKEKLSAMRDMLVREQKVMIALIKEKEAAGSSTSSSNKPDGV